MVVPGKFLADVDQRVMQLLVIGEIPFNGRASRRHPLQQFNPGRSLKVPAGEARTDEQNGLATLLLNGRLHVCENFLSVLLESLWHFGGPKLRTSKGFRRSG